MAQKLNSKIVISYSVSWVVKNHPLTRFVHFGLQIRSCDVVNMYVQVQHQNLDLVIIIEMSVENTFCRGKELSLSGIGFFL